MHIDTIPNRNSRPAYLLRESVREGKRVTKRTLANLSSLPLDQIEMIRRVLKGEKLGPVDSALEVTRSQAHGHVEAVRTALRRLGFDRLIDATSNRQRDLVVAMVAGRIVAPEASKLAMTQAWADTTLADDLGVADAHEDELYEAMDWLIERQDKIEKRLAKRHLFPQPAAIAPISLKQALINIWATIRGRTSRWEVTQRRDGQPPDATSSHCFEIILSDAQGDQLRERMAAWNVKLNDLVMVCAMSTYAKLAPPGPNQHRVTVLNPIDLRLPSDRTLPATNRFGIAFMRRPRAECLNPVAILRGIHDEMTYVRSNYVGVEFVKGLVTASKIPGGIDIFRRIGFFTPSMQWTCLGDVSRGGKRLIPWKNGMPISGNLQLATATGFAPCADNVPVSIATCEANKRVTLTVRSSPRFLSMDETQKFAETLVHSLCTFELPVDSSHVPQRSTTPTSGATDENASG